MAQQTQEPCAADVVMPTFEIHDGPVTKAKKQARPKQPHARDFQQPCS